MSSNLTIDSSKLSSEIEKLGKISRDLEDLLTNLKNENSILRENWESRTSEQVYSEFDNFYSSLESVKNSNDNDVTFLQNVVNSSYTKLDSDTNKLVDTNIAI